MTDLSYGADFDRWAENFLDELRALPKTSRGRSKALHATASEEAIVKAAKFVETTQIAVHTEQWIAEDREREDERRVAAGESPRHPGGRTPSYSTYTYWVATMACTFSGLPVSYTQIHHILTGPLSKESRNLLGLETDSDPRKDADLDSKRKRIHYTSFTRLASRVTDTYDPRPFPGRTAPTVQQAAAIDASRDPAEVARKQRRADRLASHLMLATFFLLPSELQGQFDGDITLDATVLPAWGKFGHTSRKRRNSFLRDENGDVVRDQSGQRIPQATRSPEGNAGWHAKDPDSRDMANSPFFNPNARKDRSTGARIKKTKYTYGFDGHLALLDMADLPQLILGVSLDTPGKIPGLNAAEALRGISEAGLPTGVLTVDNGYSQLAADNFAYPVRALGYDILRDFKSDELGKVLESYEGVQCVEGVLYGPCLPADLLTASKDFFEGRIDDQTYRSRLEARRIYEVRVKKNVDGSATVTYRCPGTGSHATVHCPIKEQQRAEKHNRKSTAAWDDGQPMPKPETIRRSLPLIVTTPARPPKICTNAESLTIPRERFARFLSVHGFQTPEYLAKYGPGRNRMEGKNRVLKDALAAAIADPDQRRFRGWAKQFTALVTKLVGANIASILAFIDNEERDDHRAGKVAEAKRRTRTGRPKREGLERYLPGPDQPIRQTGPHRIDLPKVDPPEPPHTEEPAA